MLQIFFNDKKSKEQNDKNKNEGFMMFSQLFIYVDEFNSEEVKSAFEKLKDCTITQIINKDEN